MGSSADDARFGAYRPSSFGTILVTIFGDRFGDRFRDPFWTKVLIIFEIIWESFLEHFLGHSEDRSGLTFSRELRLERERISGPKM